MDPKIGFGGLLGELPKSICRFAPERQAFQIVGGVDPVPGLRVRLTLSGALPDRGQDLPPQLIEIAALLDRNGKSGFGDTLLAELPTSICRFAPER